jgi:hypothetical protein
MSSAIQYLHSFSGDFSWTLGVFSQKHLVTLQSGHPAHTNAPAWHATHIKTLFSFTSKGLVNQVSIVGCC